MKYTEPEKDIRLEQGRIFGDAVHLMMDKNKGKSNVKEEKEYRIGVIREKAEGYYEKRDGKLEWREPQENENQHIEVVVMDKEDGRFIPCLNVTVTLKNSNGNKINSQKQEFIWHPFLYHYGKNWNIPEEGKYNIEVKIDTPEFPRHKHDMGNRYKEPVSVEFKDIEIRDLGKK